MTTTAHTRTRLAAPTDLDDIVRLEASSFPRPWSTDSLAQELRRDDRLWLVAEVVDGPVRTVGVGGVADLAGDAHVLTVAVDPACRRRGHGAALVRALLAGAVQRFGVRRATLEVRASNLAARSLYRGLGFDEAGVRPGYYHDGEDAVVLWCDLPHPTGRTATPGPDLAPRPDHPRTEQTL